MKKSRIAWIVLSVVLALAVIAGGVFYYLNQRQRQQEATQAELAQQTAYEQFTALTDDIRSSTLTVTENGKIIGIYDLAQLGLQEQALTDARNAYGEWDRMDPELFASLGTDEKIAWQTQANRKEPEITLNTRQLDVSGVLLDLSKEIRVAPKNAYAHLVDGAYVVEPEVPGTQLDDESVARAIQAQVAQAVITDQEPLRMMLEMTDCDAYRPAEITAENADFDYAALLAQDAAGVQIPVQLLDQTVQLDAAPLVSTDAAGTVQVDRTALEQIVAGWAETYRRENTPYILNSYVMGPIPLDFLFCNYDLDQAGLTDLLMDQLRTLDTTPVEAPFHCTRNGEDFAIEGTYVEVDIENQQMIYYKNGEVLVHTDVVTGLSWAYATPTGLYAVQNKDTDAWLTGPDYRVFVKYWVGFYGPYGLHDASWRTKFGGDNYINNGSHGCVNTPEEAMKQIYDDIEVGTPVVVHKYKKS